VAYPLSFLKSRSFAVLVEWNPLSPVVEGFRYALFGAENFNLFSLWYSIATMIGMVLVGLVMFNRVEKTFMDTV
jgi:lipopolysaccharide transport system permease protein